VLEDIALVISKYKKTTLMIEGQTDNVGDDAFNQRLSESRASSVKNYVNQITVNQRHISTIGMGEYQQIASKDTPQGRQQNRSIELKIIPISSMQ
jgi:outer membrane protein OmpA-like peptidoglycan-associated protein